MYIFQDRFPSNDDIWLAIERVIAWNCAKDNSHLFHASKASSQTIPQLIFPGYTLGKSILNFSFFKFFYTTCIKRVPCYEGFFIPKNLEF